MDDLISLFRRAEQTMKVWIGLAFLLHSSVWGSESVSLRQERQTYWETIRSSQDESTKEKARRSFEALSLLERILSPSLTPPVIVSQDLLIDSEVVQSFLKTMAEGAPPLQSDFFFTVEILRFLESIEARKQIGLNPPVPYSLNLKDGSKEKVELKLDENGRVFIQFDPVLGKGTQRFIERLVAYQTWVGLLRAGFVKPSVKAPIAPSPQELKILKMISQFRPEAQVGLVEVYRSSERTIFPKMYDLDLATALSGENEVGRGPLVLTEEQKFDLLEQIGRGLSTLHRSGIVHSDIRLENILIFKSRLPESPNFESALTGFGSAYEPRKVSRLNLLSLFRQRKSSRYTPPESGSKWTSALEKRFEAAMKGDVFSLGVVAALLLKPELLEDWFPPKSKCEQLAGKDFSKYEKCRVLALKELSQKEAQESRLDPVVHFLTRALDVLPETRLSSQMWLEGLSLLKRLKKSDSSNFTFAPTEVAPLAEKLDFVRFDSNMIAPPESAETVLASQLGKVPGNYLVFPWDISSEASGEEKQLVLALAFVDQDAKVRTMRLNVDPEDREQLKGIIQFLQSVGTLKR